MGSVMDVLRSSAPSSFCDACTVRNRAICSDLTRDELATLNGIGRQRKLHAGEQLIWEGDEAVLVANVILERWRTGRPLDLPGCDEAVPGNDA